MIDDFVKDAYLCYSVPLASRTIEVVDRLAQCARESTLMLRVKITTEVFWFGYSMGNACMLIAPETRAYTL